LNDRLLLEGRDLSRIAYPFMAREYFFIAMDRILEVTWRHTPGLTDPCLTCSDTKQSFSELLEDLIPIFREEGISVRQSEEVVRGEDGPAESLVLLNGIPISSLLSHAAVGEEYCHASKCRPAQTIHRHYPGPGGIPCDEAPEILFRKAIVLSFDEDIKSLFSALR
jgi:hypothetical protein